MSERGSQAASVRHCSVGLQVTGKYIWAWVLLTHWWDVPRPNLTWVYRVEGARDPRLNSPSLCFLRNLNEPESKDRVETLR